MVRRERARAYMWDPDVRAAQRFWEPSLTDCSKHKKKIRSSNLLFSARCFTLISWLSCTWIIWHANTSYINITAWLRLSELKLFNNFNGLQNIAGSNITLLMRLDWNAPGCWQKSDMVCCRSSRAGILAFIVCNMNLLSYNRDVRTASRDLIFEGLRLKLV